MLTLFADALEKSPGLPHHHRFSSTPPMNTSPPFTPRPEDKTPAGHRTPPPGGTSDVLVSSAELFALKERHTAEERRIFAELAANLLPRASARDRRRVASLLAPHGQTPMDVLALLALDEDALTAYPVLSQAPALREDLLERVAARGPEKLRQAIARRGDLSEPVHFTLAAAAESADTIRTLLQNPAFTLTPIVSSRLMQRSDIAAELEDELTALGALSAKELMEQYLSLPQPQRAQALAAAEQASLIDQAVGGSRPLPADPVFVAFLLKVARSHTPYKVHDEIGRVLNLPKEAVRALAEDGRGEGLAITLRALGLNETAATTVFIRLLGRRMGIRTIRKVLNLFKGISHGAATQLVGAWAGDEAAGPAIHAPLTAPPRQDRTRQGSTTGAQASNPATGAQAIGAQATTAATNAATGTLGSGAATNAAIGTLDRTGRTQTTSQTGTSEPGGSQAGAPNTGAPQTRTAPAGTPGTAPQPQAARRAVGQTGQPFGRKR